MENRNERKLEFACNSMSNFISRPDSDAESSLNPFASEFIPSYLKKRQNDNSNSHKMKSETTSTTTLVQREVVGDASYLHAQRQLFELLHQLGNKFMPLKAISLSLSPDGQGINVQFKGEQDSLSKEMLDENLCQDAGLYLEMSERSFMPRRLSNVLAANFMARMGDVLNDKMEWNDQATEIIGNSSMPNVSSTDKRPESQRKRLKSSSFSASSAVKDIMQKDHKLSTSAPGNIQETSTKNLSQLEINGTHNKLHNSMNLPRPSLATAKIPDWTRATSATSRAEMREKDSIIKHDLSHEKKSSKGNPTPRPNLRQIMKKSIIGGQKLAPRSTQTSLMRQTEVKKRLNPSKADTN